jgi:uncharacterized protein YkwD
VRTLFAVLALTVVPSTALAQNIPCTEDPRLTQAAALLALEGDPTQETLMRIVREAGSEAPRAHAISVEEDDFARISRWATSLVDRGETPLACGEARIGDRRIFIAAPAAATLTVEGAHVVGHLATGWTHPLLYTEDARGEITVRELTAPSFDTSIPDDVEAVRVQVVARGPGGPRPVAERLLGERDASLGGTSADPRERVVTLRSEAHVGPLRPNHLLDALAAQHAEDVCEAGEVVHELEDGQDPSARLREEGVVARHVGEVVSRGTDQSHAVVALVESPSHRGALVDHRFTDVGIGTAEDDEGRSCVVVLLAAWPRIVAR